MPVTVRSLDHPAVPPIQLSDRFRHDVAYFMSAPGEPGVPRLGPGEYWVPLATSKAVLDAGVIEVTSPLDAESKAEIEISEEHEAWLDWLVEHQVERFRLD